MRLRPRLRGKTLLLCAVLVIAPVLVAWLMGAYDAWTSWRYRHHLSDAAAEIGELVDRDADPDLIETASSRREVYLRVLDSEGNVEIESDPRFGDGRFSRSGWFAAVADFFHGPDGSPDLIDSESDLPPLARRSEVIAALAGESAATRRNTDSASAFVFYHAVPRDDGGAVYVARLSRRSARVLYDHRYRLLKISLLLLLVAVFVAVLAGRAVVRPLARMRASVTAHLDAGAELDLGIDRTDEIGDLARSFEIFSARLRDRATRAATASAELAHDMKSPISAVLTSAELLESGAGRADPDRQRRIAAGIRCAAEHLDRAVQGFMALAALDEELLSSPRSPTDVGAVASEVIAEVSALAQHEAVRFEQKLSAGAIVAADPKRIAQMLRNVIDNAADFASSRVLVSVAIVDQGVRISIADDGPGVTGATRERVFERFFSARSGDTTVGRGLGLAIVDTIARAYGGTAALLPDRPLGGAAFEISLPRT